MCEALINFVSRLKYLLFSSSLFLACLHANWTSTPITIDSGNASSAAPLVIDAQGNVTSAWLENYDIIGDDPQAAFFSFSSNQWMAPQPIILAGAGLAAPQLIVDRFGTVTLIWLEYYNEGGNSSTLFASRSTNGGAWTTPVPLNSLTISTNAQVPVSMVVDTQGNVTVAWLEQDIATSNYAIGAARFTADISASPTLYPFLDGASPNANNTIIPHLVVDQLGYVTAVWQELTTSSDFAVQAARLDPSGMAWSTAINLDGMSPKANNAITPQMVVDTSGIVTVVWQEIISDTPQFSVQTARFTPGMGGAGGSWTTYTALAPALSNANGSITPQILVDKYNSVTVVAVDSGLSVWPSSFVAGTWTYPSAALNSGTAFSLTPLSMVADNSGIVTIVWLNNNAGELFVQTARGFSTSWNAAINLNAGNADGNTPLLIVIDTFGDITTSWMEGSSIQAARFLSGGSSWSETRTLDSGNLYNQIPPKMVVGPSGAVTVVWQESTDMSGAYAIQAARVLAKGTSWTPAITLNNGLQSPNAYYSSMTQQINMAVDSFDNVTVTWLESVGSNVAVQSARFAYTAPGIREVVFALATELELNPQADQGSREIIVNVAQVSPFVGTNPQPNEGIREIAFKMGTIIGSNPQITQGALEILINIISLLG